MAFGQSAELLFRISGDASDGVGAIRSTSAELKQLEAVTKSVGSSIQNIGSSLSSVGSQLTVAVTAPLVALSGLGVKAALEFDAINTKLIALTGSSEAATQKIAELTALAERSVGVTRTAALESFAQLKGIGGISDETINNVIASLGKLNAAFKIDDIKGFQANLNQIFKQGFERADIKEAIGRIPFFEDLLEQAFGTSDGAKLKALKDSGKLTLETFLSGISEAVNTDPRVANITENLSLQLTKGIDKAQQALVPLGDAILKLVVPALNAIIPYIQQASEFFASLSAPVQTVVIAVAALAAAAGPLLIIIGGLVTAVGAILAAAVPLGIALLAIVGLIVQLGPLLVVVAAGWAALATAWQQNAGGIRTATTEAFNAVRITIQTALASITAFWNAHKTQILEVVNSIWNGVKSVVQAGINILASAISLGLNIINGNWQGAWNSFLSIIQNAVRAVTVIANGFFNAVTAVLSRILSAVVQYGPTFIAAMASWASRAVVAVVLLIATLPARLIGLIPTFIQAGNAIGSAIFRGIQAGLAAGASAGGSLTFAEGGAGGSVAALAGLPSIGTGKGAGGAGGAGVDTSAADKARELRERDLQAALQIEKNNLATIKDEYAKVFDELREKLKSGQINLVEFLRLANAETATFKGAFEASLSFIEELERRSLATDATEHERALLKQEQLARRNELERAGEEERQTNLETIEARRKSLDDDAQKRLEEQIDAYRGLLELRLETLDVEKKILDLQANVARERFKGNISGAENTPDHNAAVLALRDFEIAEAARKQQQIEEDLERERNAAIARLTAVELEAGQREEIEALYREKHLLAEEEFQERLSEIRRIAAEQFQVEGGFLGAFESFIETIGSNITVVDLLADSFRNLADGVGAAIQQYVLYGKSVSAALRQVLAATLAQIAAEAAVQAIRAAAYGFLFLATGNYAAAANAFISAAIWGSIAVGAALVGRAIAPKQQEQVAAKTGFNQQANAATGSTRDTSAQGQQFSSREDATQDINANAPQGREPQIIEIRFKEKPDWLARALELEVSTNTGVRQTIRAVAQDA